MRLPVQKLMERYQNNLYAVAFNVCKNVEDAEDVVQDTLIQYYTNKKDFENEQHIRAWMIRVAINKAKNMNRTFWRQNKMSLEDYCSKKYYRRNGKMTNKEKYKQAFSVLQTSDDFSLEVEKMTL